MNDGGHAFPTGDFSESGYSFQHPGMSLRDYFAAAAMQAWLGTYSPEDQHPASHPTLGDKAASGHAFLAYKMADAMIAAREPKPAPDINAGLPPEFRDCPPS